MDVGFSKKIEPKEGLMMRDVNLVSLSHEPISLNLSLGKLGVLTGSERILIGLFNVLTQRTQPSKGLISFGPNCWGAEQEVHDLALRERRYPWVSAMFPQRFSDAAWIENLNLDENILLPGMWFGETPKKLALKANKLAQEFGLGSIPDCRRSEASLETLALCQWVRALLNRHAKLFVLYEPFKEVPRHSVPSLVLRMEKKMRKGTTFLWLIEDWNEEMAPSLFSRLQNVPQIQTFVLKESHA